MQRHYERKRPRHDQNVQHVRNEDILEKLKRWLLPVILETPEAEDLKFKASKGTQGGPISKQKVKGMGVQPSGRLGTALLGFNPLICQKNKKLKNKKDIEY